MTVVCDSSALINLSHINQLRLLEEMYSGVLIPTGVYDEVVRIGAGRVGSEDVRDASFIEVVSVSDHDRVENHVGPLSPVDAQVIVLADEQRADLIITRDRRLRRRAAQEGLAVIRAKQAGFISAVRPLLDELLSKGVLIREGFYAETLRRAGELEAEEDD